MPRAPAPGPRTQDADPPGRPFALPSLPSAAAMKGMKLPKNLKGDINPRNMQVGGWRSAALCAL